MSENEKIGNDLELVRSIFEKNEMEFEELQGETIQIELEGKGLVFSFTESGDLLEIIRD